VLIEGTVVGMTSWILSVALSWPLGLGLSNAVGIAVFNDAIPYVYSYAGMLGWLLLAGIIGALASLVPAHRASRLTVRQVLAYE
jgi:putative ABC transport system permease protein